MKSFLNRKDAGKMLAKQLKQYTKNTDTLVLALPRGGVPVAYEIAKALNVPWDVFIVRKLGVPGHKELAMGAIAMQGVMVFNQDIVHGLGIPETAINQTIQAEQQELRRRESAYRGKRPFPEVAGKTIILVDDGMATGATMRVAIKALQQLGAAKIVATVPVAAVETCEEIATLADSLICPLKPVVFFGVGAWYSDFSQVTDAEVHELLVKDSL